MRAAATKSWQAPRRLLSAGMLALFLSACGLKTAPDREALRQENLPNLKLPAAWVESSATGPVQDNWIATLGDPQLPALVAEAITYNADLRLAVARVEEAAANVKAAGAQLYPSVNLLGKTGGKVGGDGSGVGGV